MAYASLFPVTSGRRGAPGASAYSAQEVASKSVWCSQPIACLSSVALRVSERIKSICLYHSNEGRQGNPNGGLFNGNGGEEESQVALIW
jgi:hypothetical protein